MSDAVLMIEAQDREYRAWHGCYDDGWQGDIVPEAFAHPAKVSRALIRRIYQHAFVEGWLLPGDVVVDPFGGIAGTALDAMWNGLTWIGGELEPKFVALGQQNIDLWNRKYGSKPGFGSARILQGDSRRLGGVIAAADVVLSSPPYATSLADGGPEKAHPDGYQRSNNWHGYGCTPGQLEKLPEGTAPALICSSPPYAAISTGAGGLNTKPGADGQQSGRSASSASQDTDQRYGESVGQLATMREGDAPACIVSSPPFVTCRQDTTASAGGIALARPGDVSIGMHYGQNERNGISRGQLGAMPEGRFDAVVSSPPYETGGHHQHQMDSWNVNSRGMTGNRLPGYADESEGQLGGHGDTFWQAAREIVAQCHAILRPGGHAIWICKDFVRKGKRIPFSDQWQALCEQQGFRLVCRHRAMLVKRHGEQDTIFGDSEQVTTQRKSFFRRLAEKKGSPPIDFEDVICLERVANRFDVDAEEAAA